jgi:hypothetical protein
MHQSRIKLFKENEMLMNTAIQHSNEHRNVTRMHLVGRIIFFLAAYGIDYDAWLLDDSEQAGLLVRR